MTAKEAKKLFEKDLEHTRQHLQDKNKDPEFIEDMKRWEQAEELAIKALSTQTEEEKRTRERILRLEKTIEHMLRGVRVEIKEVTGHGLTEEEILFLRDNLNSIRDDLYGEDNVHFPLPEEEPKDE